MVLDSSISNYFTNETSLANKWMSFSSSNLALTELFLVVFFNLYLLLPIESSVIHNSLLPNHFLLCEIKAISTLLSRSVLLRLNSSHTVLHVRIRRYRVGLWWINPNWYEAVQGGFTPLMILELNFYQKFPNIFGGRKLK